MSYIEVSENVRRRRATVNLSRSLGCHRSTYNRRWNKMKAAFMKKYHFLSFSEFAKESTLKEVKREVICNESTSTNKKYVIVDVLRKKQLMIASKEWIVGKELCAFPNELVDIHLQKCNQPNENWSLMKCKVIHELDSLQSAKDLLVALQILESQRKNTSTDENTLPLNTEKPKRGVIKRKEDFLYNSVDMDVAEMQAGNSRVQYPKFRLFDKLISPIANSTQLETSPSTSECEHVGGALVDHCDRLYTAVLNMSSAINDLTKTINNLSSAIMDLNVNVNQLLSKSNKRERLRTVESAVTFVI
ncbi:unnamed protein product [Schistosoma curassoni]|nr:unnamed protein product [Schistosoma curassoni]